MTAFPAFAPQAPVVVDSPLPQTPGAQIPVPAGQQPFTAGPEQTVPGTAAEPVQTPEDVTTQLGQTLGLDLSQFPTLESKQAAVKWAIERYAATGFSVAPAVEPQAPAASVGPIPAEDDDDDDHSVTTEFDTLTGITDPKVVKQIKALEKRLQKAESENKRIQDTFAAQQQAVYDNQVAELTRRTESAIDRMASAKYGVGGQKTFAQQVSRENLKRLAGSIIHGLQSQPGQQIPVIEEIVRLAAYYDNGGNLPQAPPQNQPTGMFPPGLLTPAASQPAMVPTPQPPLSAFGRTATHPNARPVIQEKDYYTKDPQYMAGAKAILQRGR